MADNTYFADALPVTITGTPGVSQMSLLDVLKQAYGDQVSSISSVNVAYYGADYLANRTDNAGNKEQPFSYWDPTHPTVTKILENGVDIGASTQSNFNTVTVNAADFANVTIEVGNNIMPNLYIQVPTAHNSDGSTDYQELNVTTIPKQLEPHLFSPFGASSPLSILTSNASLAHQLDPNASFHSPFSGAVAHSVASGSLAHFPGMLVSAASAASILTGHTGLTHQLDPSASFHSPFSNVSANSTASGSLSHFSGAASAVDTTLLGALKAGFVAAHVPTAAEVVAAAEHIATLEKGVANVNDCHYIAMDTAAAAGAPLDPVTQTSTDMVVGGKDIVTETPGSNQEGGFWRIAFRGDTDHVTGGDWQSLVKPGDIVRLGWLSGGFHTLTVIEGEDADGKHPGRIEVVDNGGNTIQRHWVDYNSISNTNEVTIYRLTTDGLNLIDGSSSTHADTWIGTAGNDLIKAGSGGDTLLGGDGNDTLVTGKGNDTLDGGAGDNTAVFTGKESDYHFTFNADGSMIVADQRAGSPDGIDTLKNIQHLQFTDGTFSPNAIKIGTEVNHWSVVNHWSTENGSRTLLGGVGKDALASSQSDAHPVAPAVHHVAHDFNGNGIGDHSKGQIAMWQMNGDHIAATTTVGSTSGMTVIGSGDYNHDGKAEVMLQGAGGHVTEWHMNGDHITAHQTVGSHTIDWHMV